MEDRDRRRRTAHGARRVPARAEDIPAGRRAEEPRSAVAGLRHLGPRSSGDRAPGLRAGVRRFESCWGHVMGNVMIDMSMSLDGYIAARTTPRSRGLRETQHALHNWMFDDPSVFEEVYGEVTEKTGAVIMGRRSYDNSIDARGGRVRSRAFPASSSRTERSTCPTRSPRWSPTGIESALAKAREVAGDKEIGLMGANLDQQYLAAGLVDQIRIHLVDVLLGGGRRLFDTLRSGSRLEQTEVSRPAA